LRNACNIKPTLLAVLSDIDMPGMDGLGLLGEIKQLRPDLPVMMVTAYGEAEWAPMTGFLLVMPSCRATRARWTERSRSPNHITRI
jgi:CheY-like chemotaxis protein